MSERETEKSQDPVVALLRQATPRPVPPIEDEQAIRATVEAEWRSVVKERKAGNRWLGLAIAASVLVAVAAAFATLRSPTVDRIEVASIERHKGQVYRRGEGAELTELDDETAVYVGQMVETASSSALGLGWIDGSSLRLDADTRVEIIDRTTVFLHRGRIYFDSAGSDEDARLVVDTEYGSVAHLGTQYMTAVDADALIVSVREGEVQVDGRYYDETIGRGKQIRILGSSRPVVLEMEAHSGAWMWTESVSPGPAGTHLTIFEFLQWIGRETGYEIVFDDEAAAQLASTEELVGRVDGEPRTALRLNLMTTDLDYLFDEEAGILHIRIVDAGPP